MPPERPRAEQRRVDERVTTLDAVKDEQPDQHRRPKQGAPDGGRSPAPVAALGKPEREEGDPGGDQHHAKRVGTFGFVTGDVRETTPPYDEGGDADR